MRIDESTQIGADGLRHPAGTQPTDASAYRIGVPTEEEVDTSIAAAIADLVAGAGPEDDTLAELAAKIAAIDIDYITATDVEITDATKGVILTDVNGGRWRVTISAAGALSTTLLGV